MAASLQIVGAVLILFPYLRSQLGSLDTRSGTYLWPNLLGSILLAALALIGSQWGFVMLEACWAVATLRSLLQSDGALGA